MIVGTFDYVKDSTKKMTNKLIIHYSKVRLLHPLTLIDVFEIKNSLCLTKFYTLRLGFSISHL